MLHDDQAHEPLALVSALRDRDFQLLLDLPSDHELVDDHVDGAAPGLGVLDRLRDVHDLAVDDQAAVSGLADLREHELPILAVDREDRRAQLDNCSCRQR